MTTKQPIETSDPQPTTSSSRRILAKSDPILLELWEIKRQLNTEAHFDIAQLAKQANQFDAKKALEALRAVH